MLVLKLILTPVLIGLVSLVGRRWGPAVSGWFVGLPLTSGPISLYLALDQGTAFAAHAAQGTLLGLISGASFCLVYSWVARQVGWFGSLLAGWAAFFAATFALAWLTVPLVIAFVGVIAFLTISLRCFPKSAEQTKETPTLPGEVFLRMGTATAFVLALTAVSGLLGPQLSGLLTPFPIYATILGAFTHHFQGASAACRLLRGVVFGTFTFAIFFLIVAATLPRESIAIAFGTAILASLLLHGCSLWFVKRYLDTP